MKNTQVEITGADAEPRWHPVLFSAPMVRAILEGRKTQTRRVVTKANSATAIAWDRLEFDDAKIPAGAEWCRTFADNGYLHVATQPNPKDPPQFQGADSWTRNRVYPRWQVGDRLWVRETWQQIRHVGNGQWCTVDPLSVQPDSPARRIIYAADIGSGEEPPRWRPSIHMPRWASRITLEVTAIRGERLQEISEEDAQAEGSQCAGVPASLTNRGAFAKFWDSLNADRVYSWKANPWVWATTFKRVNSA